MISVDQALDEVLGRVDVLDTEESPILGCLGQVLAEDVYSPIDIPPLDNSAMDGFAVRSEDTRGASPQSPRSLRVIGISIPGSICSHQVEPGAAVRIMTGAPVPQGADSVVRFEDTDKQGREETSSEIGILTEVQVGTDIRRAGEDVTRGTIILPGGTVVRPPVVGVLASLGRATVTVIRRPVVTILTTGDELVDVGQPLPLGKIYNSNAYSIAALVLRCGGIPRMLGVALDSKELLAGRLGGGLDADILITTGGVSLGDYDVVKDVVEKQGEIVFWRVRLKPGKPLVFGMLRAGESRHIPYFGLPGNPVSSMVTFELFVRPAILKMAGRENLARPVIRAVVGEPIVNEDGRRIFARAVVEKRDGQYFARLTGPQGSGILTSMALANGLVIVPEDKARVEAGDVVQVMMMGWGEEVADLISG